MDLAVCKAMIRTGSRTFYAASIALPRPVREPAYALYAFCRLADDVVDEEDASAGSVAMLRARLDRVYAGDPLDHPVDRALTDVVRRFGMPRPLLDALIEGLEWDTEGRRYDTLEDLYAYGARVAGAVGAMMTVLMGRREAHVIARACDLGVAMQLTNIARDVGEDARNGRLYLPRAWLREADIDPDAWLAEPRFDDRLASVVQRLLDAADRLYDCALCGIGDLPLACRPSIHAARLLYAEIGRELERLGRDSVSVRAVVPARRKVWLLLRAMVDTVLAEERGHGPCLNEVRFLVDAVADRPLPAGFGEVPPSMASVDHQVGWVVDLFTRLEQAERVRLRT
ncbi:MAG: phytoene/squalene synthase family protein [Pseudomonadota bacterium]